MNKIALILPYFGKLPLYFNLWIESAKKNKNFDFMIFTDQEVPSYKNILVYKMEFQEIKELIVNKLDCKIKLNKPYKLCDFRPAYGLIFEDYIKNYTHWGHCDPDVIWGNLSKFITDDILNNYDRIYTKGHLTIYKNEHKANNIFKSNSIYSGVTYNDIFLTSYSCHFDEGEVLTKIHRSNGFKIYDRVDYADILCNTYEFRLFEHNMNFQAIIFNYSNGSIYGYYKNKGKICCLEFSYVHLQKRKMTNYLESNINYFIVPNSFIQSDMDKIEELVDKYTIPCKDYEKKYKKMIVKMQLENIKNGALIYRWKNRKLNKERV